MMSEVVINKPALSESGNKLQRRRVRSVSPFDELEQLFEGFFPSGRMQPLHREWPELSVSFEEGRIPKVDMLERDDAMIVRAELPGVEKDNLEISLAEESVTISAATKQESEDEKGDYHRREISRAAFSRTLPLPVAVQGDQAKASFKDGVLELTLPKVAPAKRHTIKVE